MKVQAMGLLPSEYGCNLCGLTKPVAEMVLVRLRREKAYLLRPLCKDCHNQRERGHRREWKTKYLRGWRFRNRQLSDSYWRGNPAVKEKARIRAAARFEKKHEAILIQGRLNRRGMGVSLKQAEELLQRFGPCYPSRLGLTPRGLRECERIRAGLRRRRTKRISTFEIRLMVYEDGLHIKPGRQTKPFLKAAERLREWHRAQGQKKIAAAAAA
ncbi:MAG: hypothetical protein AABN33_18275 [Acidobacteriota bacterium]